MSRPLNNNKGMALLLVVSLVSVLAVITLQFSKEMRDHYIVSASLRSSTRLAVMAEAGITIAREILIEDQQENIFDSALDSWALLGEEDLSTLFEYGEIEVSIYDEGGKFQVNAMIPVADGSQNNAQTNTANTANTANTTKVTNAANAAPAATADPLQRVKDIRNILWRLLRAEPFLLEDGKARGIIDSLIDWLDSEDGDGEEEYGAEDNYYHSLNPPYSCKNGPIESIEELLLVKGITEELLYGTEDIPALAPLLTPLGDNGTININTADVLLLQALHEAMTKEAAEVMVEFREDENNSALLENSQWYKNVPSFPGDIELQQDLITTSSNFFTIEAMATLEEQQKTITATVERSDTELNTLRWDSD